MTQGKSNKDMASMYRKLAVEARHANRMSEAGWYDKQAKKFEEPDTTDIPERSSEWFRRAKLKGSK